MGGKGSLIRTNKTKKTATTVLKSQSLIRFNVGLTPELHTTIIDDARKERRTVNNQILWILEQHYRSKDHQQ